MLKRNLCYQRVLDSIKENRSIVYEAAKMIPDTVAGTIYSVKWVSINACRYIFVMYYTSELLNKNKKEKSLNVFLCL
ncbi:hypothetical protein VNO77_42641 [Canavalia gladiata]|uniref:Uncharacterized protein n=1 Tax=Canavalia gladiata TaxID=3824 RepID=A0AAN9JUW7_CANGL